MTDWWANIGDVGGSVSKNDFARLVLSGNDFYAVCPDGSENVTGDNTLEELGKGGITRGQLIRSASHICSFLLNTNALRRMRGMEVSIEPYGRVLGEDTVQDEVTYFQVGDGTVIDLSDVECYRGSSYVIGVNVMRRGCYFMDMTAKSDQSDTAQLPIAIFFQSIPGGTFAFRGSEGREVTLTRKILFSSRYGVLRFNFLMGGPKPVSLKFRFEEDLDPNKSWGDYQDYIYG